MYRAVSLWQQQRTMSPASPSCSALVGASRSLATAHPAHDPKVSLSLHSARAVRQHHLVDCLLNMPLYRGDGAGTFSSTEWQRSTNSRFLLTTACTFPPHPPTEQRLAAAAAAAPRWHTGQDKCSGALKCLPACPLLSSCLYLRLRAPSLIDRGLVPSATLRVPDLPHARCTYTGWSRQRATRPGSAMCLISVCDAHATRMPHRHTPIPRLRPTRLRKRRCLTHTEMRRCSTLVLPTVTLALPNALPFPHRFNPPES